MDHQVPVTLGSSLLVPSVQEMARKSVLDAIPTRYIRDDVRADLMNVRNLDETDHLLPSLPIIDMKALLDDEGEVMDLELEKLHLACKDWGFFQLVNHNVNEHLVAKAKGGIQDFFNLSIEEKQKYWQKPGDVEGFGQAFVVSEEQKLDWGDMFFVVTQPEHQRKPYLFPLLPHPFRETLEEYSIELRNLAMKILKMMCKALKMDIEDMKPWFENGQQAFRMNYYPPCPQPEQVIGLTPHSDAVGLTILLQINDVEGLQIRKDGMWVPVKPLTNAFIVNVGDILEIVTNGIYRSIEHRAVVNSSKERLSIATFHSPRVDGEIGPAPSLISSDSPPLFKRIKAEDYFKGLFTRELAGKSYLDSMRV
ncbi:hypothetical protein Syun_028480 [Stephania yunnanensis]|uniref:Fe2OG dioxygenase domain-containing protein n=1 Tax=Stephania yunnanensis TaxID=152371 RepID=A0AAP0HNV5_9MAGN